jgi:DNA-binding NarL/FixJ family response regulator
MKTNKTTKKEQIIKMIKMNWKDETIAKKTNSSVNSVRWYRSKMNNDQTEKPTTEKPTSKKLTSKKPTSKKPTSKKIVSKKYRIIKLISQNINTKEIARRTNSTINSVRWYRSKMKKGELKFENDKVIEVNKVNDIEIKKVEEKKLEKIDKELTTNRQRVIYLLSIGFEKSAIKNQLKVSDRYLKQLEKKIENSIRLQKSRNNFIEAIKSL